MNQTYTFKHYEEKLNKLNGRDCVRFALFCAKTVNPNTKESNLCIKLVENWLINENSVNKKELWDASVNANANAVCAAYYAAYAAYYAASAAYSAVSAIKVDPSKTEEINNYLEELLNPKPVTQNVTMEDYRNQMKLDNVKKLTKEVLTLIEVNPEELVKLLNYDVLNEKMKILVKNINCLNSIQTDV